MRGRSSARRRTRAPLRAGALLGVSLAVIAVGAEPPLSESLASAARLIDAGQFPVAVARLREIVSEYPSDVDALVLLGSALSHVSRRDEAIGVLIRAAELSPGEPWVHAAVGSAMARLGEMGAALHAHKRAVELDPVLAESHLSIALIFAGQGEPASAAPHMAEAIALETDRSKRARLHFLNGKLQGELGALQAARGEFERSIALAPDRGEAHLGLGLVRLRLQQPDQARRSFERAVQISGTDSEAHYQLGLALQRAREYAGSARHLQRAHELRPDDQAIVYNLTRALHSAGRNEDAAEFRERLSRMIAAKDRSREHELATAELHGEAVRLDRAGDHSGAVEKYAEVLRYEPLNAVARRNLALALCRLGRWDEGIGELEGLLRVSPDDAETARILAIVLDRARKPGTVAVPGPPLQP